MQILFWVFIFILTYHIIGYPMILSLMNIFKKNTKIDDSHFDECECPTITVLCPAYNEVDVIEEKLESFLKLDYPQDKMEFIVVSDDSDDGTNEIVEQYSLEHKNIKLIVQKPRKGKPSGHNLVEPTISSDYVLSTDANSVFEPNAISILVTNIESDMKIGMVSGNLNLIKKNGDSGEGYYWKYEKILRNLESRIKSMICSNGSLYLIKRQLFEQIHPSSVDDFERTLFVLKMGYKVKYCKEAVVSEDVTSEPKEEIKRKIRIISREWFAIFRQSRLLNPMKFPLISFFLFSHKILRWLFGPIAILMFAANGFLLSEPFFLFIFLIQLVVYILSIIELLLEEKGRGIKYLKFPAYFVAMIYSSSVALLKFITGKQQTMWSTDR
jgi:cellulose synthase/poly-beta-1,6-N-acetylglucosamine synthase-like glycosyltransferase